MPGPAVTVEEVHGRVAFRRFVELPYALHRREPRWAPTLAAVERWRLDPARNPFFERGDAIYLLARRGGRVAGRITAHVADRDGSERGWFGFYCVDDDGAVAAALVDRARDWVRERGATTITGPVSFTVDDEAGVLAEGFEVSGLTGRPWHPPWSAAHLEAAGLHPDTDRPTWRLDAARTAAGTSPPRAGGPLPPHAGRYADPALVVHGGSVAAVPDVSGPLRDGPLALARAVRRHAITVCTVVRVAGDPAEAVPSLCAAADGAGYRWVVSPWAPAGSGPPEAVHGLYTGAV